MKLKRSTGRPMLAGLGSRRRRWGAAFDLKKHKLAEGWEREEWGIANRTFLVSKNWVTRVTGFWHNPRCKATNYFARFLPHYFAQTTRQQ
jgi:hypothetical protein